jgi:hypothetical protein
MRPRACLIKLITAVVYGFRNKLVFVFGKPFQSSLVFTYKHPSLLRKPQITAVISFMIQAPRLPAILQSFAGIIGYIGITSLTTLRIFGYIRVFFKLRRKGYMELTPEVNQRNDLFRRHVDEQLPVVNVIKPFSFRF